MMEFSFARNIKCVKISLDITWIKYKSLTESDNLPDPDVWLKKLLRTCNLA